MLVEFPEGVFGPRWSPDGQSISFRRGWTSPHIGLFRINIDGSHLVQLTNTEYPKY
jgi:Tol biopolymer transport system component